jgi:hypothetical protein
LAVLGTFPAVPVLLILSLPCFFYKKALTPFGPPHFKLLPVNTKNWYRKGTDLWAEFGKEAPFGRKFSKDSVKMLAVGSTPSFGKGAVCA